MQVTKIVEGGINLVTGEQLEAGIVVSNGQREVTIQVSRESMEKIAHLYADGVMSLAKPSAVQPISENNTLRPFGNGNGAHHEDIPEHDPTVHGPVFVPSVDDVAAEFQPAPPTPVFADDDEYSAPPVSTDHIEEDDGFEPGEEYDDSGTGVGSL